MKKTITALEPQKNNPQRVNVYLDHQFAFGISRIGAAWLHCGECLSEVEIQNLLNNDVFEKAYQKALRFLAFRVRTESEVRAKLSIAGCEQPTIQEVISVLHEKGYLDDAQFARDWVDSRSASKPRGHRLFAYELKKKGVASEAVDEAISQAPPEREMAYALGLKFSPRYAHLSEIEFRRKLQGVLARRVFSYDVIREVVDQLIHHRNIEEEK